jgi:hypothetical protein
LQLRVHVDFSQSTIRIIVCGVQLLREVQVRYVHNHQALYSHLG